jgi:rhodanese-related sulfurtransferase
MKDKSDRVSAEVLLRRIDAGTAPVILDVRSSAEFARGHVPGAQHIPFWRVSSQIDQFRPPRDAEVVVYCGHGPRAFVAARALRRKGYTRVSFLEGHFSQWRRAGFREEL